MTSFDLRYLEFHRLSLLTVDLKVFFKKDALKNFVRFTGKYLEGALFLAKWPATSTIEHHRRFFFVSFTIFVKANIL